VPGSSGNGAPFWADPNAPSRGSPTASVPGAGTNLNSDPVGQPGNDPEVSGILAGKLVDSFGRAPGAAYIQVAMVGEGAGPPIDVETVNQGHFYIRGLRPGRTYRLVARTQVDGRLLVGEVQARPPETRLLIPLSEDLAGASTPPVPGAPQPPRRPRSGAPARPTAPAVAPWTSGPAAELGPPQAAGPGFGPAPQPRPDQIAGAQDPAPPRASIPNPTPVPPPVPGLPSTAPVQPQSYLAPAPAPPMSPACLIVNGRVQTLRLPDPDGGTWDFAQHGGRLVLLDFWGTWCGPCVHAIPELVRLQANYGNRGLEVVGIACERGAPADNARRVRDAQRKLAINYRVVLADPYGRCPVQGQFRIQQYPTLVLLDADGTILWRGGADQAHELEQLIRRRLGL
jgi:thiol-disulfide isomerase/thioredoxin